MKWTHVYELAKELGVSPLDVISHARAAGINVLNASAKLRPNQVEAIRQRFQATPPLPPRLSGPPPLRVNTRPPSSPWTKHATCPCCDLRFSYDGSMVTKVNPAPTRCDPCREHFEVDGEDPARQVARLTDHDARLRQRLSFASSKATEYEERMKSAYRARQKWKAALAEVILSHEKTTDGCNCGAKAFPCQTIRRLESANRGIAREIEHLSTLSDAALKRELYGSDPWLYDDWSLSYE